ncbi:MAG: ABC transporter ATP-binding protein [Planctomycetes bacterium]|nr:ABC transporter ATP-binding protein [Planctomycetota bacterium]
MTDAVGLVLEAVEKRFGDHQALAGVDLTVRPGEFFTLLGPSGCGKTTLLRVVAGFERPDAGTVSLGGNDLAGVPPHKRDIGLVFQSYALFPHLDVAENVAFGLVERGLGRAEREEQVRLSLARVRLSDLGERAPSELSGGQQQRVGIARALAIGPQLLLMDEPLSNLDAKLRLTMREEIRALQQADGTTTIYVTHDQEEALAISDRIAVLSEGRIEQVGTPWEIYRRPTTIFVAGFVGQISWVPAEQIPELAGAASQVGFRPEELRLVSERPSGPALEGQVAKISFTGARLRVQVEVKGGLSLLVDEHRPDPTRWAVAGESEGEGALKVGSSVWVELPAEGGHPFDASGARLG